jgi:hypothetical protein
MGLDGQRFRSAVDLRRAIHAHLAHGNAAAA